MGCLRGKYVQVSSLCQVAFFQIVFIYSSKYPLTWRFILPPKRVYLAGPEVFLSNAKEVGKCKKALCRKYGFEGVFPLDVEADLGGKSPKEIGLCISGVNEALIKNCDIVIANLTPFRGPSADVGTAYEIGFAHALGKKVFGLMMVAHGKRPIQNLLEPVVTQLQGHTLGLCQME